MNGIVPIELYGVFNDKGDRGFGCLAQDTQCIYTGECTNHASAGDYRSEYGMQPLITILEVDRKILRCATRGSEPAKSDVPYEIIPTVCAGYGPSFSVSEVNTQQLSLPL